MKSRHLADAVKQAVCEIQKFARTREQSVRTAKVLFELADCAVRLAVEEALTQEQEMTESPDFSYG